MNIVKPQRIALLFKPYEHLGACHLAVTAVLYFPFAQPRYLLPEIAMWKLVAQEFGKDAVFDMCMPKPRAEVLVVGKCYAPGGQPVGKSSVRLSIGDPAKPLLEKRLNVFGERTWQRRATGVSPSDPAPFVEIPIDYVHAFGGAGYAQNPVGKGAGPLPTDTDGQVIHPLPNVEDVRYPIVSPDDKPSPASFAPLDFTWPQRAAKAGTYDQKWLRERFPAYADDIDLAIFNAAPDDQWLGSKLAGDEAFAVAGMHPEKALVQGSLPDLAMRCFINQRASAGSEFREVSMRAETLWLVPHAERAMLVYRGVAMINTDDAEDVSALMVGAEARDAPRSVEYYKNILEMRLDPKEGVLHILRDEELLPPMPERTVPFHDDSGAEDWIYAPKGHQRRRLRTKMEKDFDRAKLQMAAARSKVLDARQRLLSIETQLATLPPSPQLAAKKLELAATAEGIAAQLKSLDEFLAFELPPDPPPVTLEELPALKKRMVEEGQAAMDQARIKIAAAEKNVGESMARAAQSVEDLRQRAEKAGATPAQLAAMPKVPDYEALKRVARQNAGGPPKPFAQPILDKLRAVEARVQAIDVRVPEGVSGSGGQSASVDGPVAAARAKASQALHEQLPRFEKMLPEGERQLQLMYRQNAHVMLPAMTLGGDANAAARATVSAAHAARASLAGADFTGADFSGLALAGIDLHDALLEGVNFSGADLSAADLGGAVLARAIFAGARLCGAKLAGANLGFANLRGADVTGAADLSGATLANADLEGADFAGAKCDKADFLGARLIGAKMSKISAPGANFLNVDLRTPDEPPRIDLVPPPAPDLDMHGACFAGARLEGARFVNCIVEDIDFSGANLAGAVFLAAKGDRCNFRGADLANVRFVLGCSFADCDFSGARLEKANLRGTKLENGKFGGALATNADFTESNLKRADFSGVLACGARFTKADLSLARMQGINLMDGVLQKARLHGTQLQGANLFGADLLRIKVDAGTDLSRARMGRTLAGAVDKK